MLTTPDGVHRSDSVRDPRHRPPAAAADNSIVGRLGPALETSSAFPTGRYVFKGLTDSNANSETVEAYDNKYKVVVAIKVFRKDTRVPPAAAKRELQVLEELKGGGGTQKMLRWFEHKGHFCMSFDNYPETLKSTILAR